MNNYYLFLDDTVHGPLSVQGIESMLQAGTISQDTPVAAEGSSEWTTIGQLFNIQYQPPPPHTPGIKPATRPSVPQRKTRQKSIWQAAATALVVVAALLALFLFLQAKRANSAVTRPATAASPTTLAVPDPTAPPSGFSAIQAGSFQMGNAMAADTEITNAQIRTVTVSKFYIGRNLVTKAEWDEVRTWGLAHGYTDLTAGAGKAPNHPVYSIDWYEIVKWCNARSEKDGLTPCYTLNGTVYRTTESKALICNWAASGYRLPTEAE